MRLQYDEKVRELNEKNARVLAQNSRYKTENERLEKLYQATKNENVKLNEQIDNLIKNTKRKEGNTWKEINRIVEHATKPSTNNVSFLLGISKSLTQSSRLNFDDFKSSFSACHFYNFFIFHW